MNIGTLLKRYSPLLLFLAIACITPYDPGINKGQQRVVVEGLLTNLPGPHKIRITQSAAYSDGGAGINIGIEGATVYVTDDTGTRIDFAQSGAGNYLTLPEVQGIVGRSYQVHITLADGSQYISEPELLKPIPPVDEIYWEYDSEKKQIGVYVDLTDPATPGDGYYWKWWHYEQIQYCKLSESQSIGGQMIQTPCLDCCTSCWDITQCFTCVNIAGDQYTNGQKIRKQLITTVAYNSISPYYLLIEQRSLSNNAYQFWNSVKVQSTGTGGPFDAAPAPVIGNIKNETNPQEKVLGFFGASAVIRIPYWLPRNQINDIPETQFPPNCPSITGPPPPCFPCMEEPGFRTQLQPPAWNQ